LYWLGRVRAPFCDELRPDDIDDPIYYRKAVPVTLPWSYNSWTLTRPTEKLFKHMSVTAVSLRLVSEVFGLVASSGVWPSETAQGHPLSSIILRSLGRKVWGKVWGVSGSDRYVSATLRDAMTPSVSGQNLCLGNAGEYGAWSVCRVTDVSHRAGWLAESWPTVNRVPL
jgi:hypothetical protein